jgi:hypothetical protein
MMEGATQDVEAVLRNDATKPKPQKAPATATERPPGRSLFPVARVQKILKADKVYTCPKSWAIFNREDFRF